MNNGARADPPDEGILASLLEYLPDAWKERLVEAVDLDLSQVDWLGDESTRVGGNLLLLLERGWPEMVSVGGRVAIFALAGIVLAGIATALLGWVLYLLVAGPLIRKGWQTGRLVGCLAASTAVLCAGVGGAWAGLWLGAGKSMEEAIEEKYVVERFAAATFLAFALDEGEYPQSVDPEAVEALLDRAQGRSADAWASFRARAEKAGNEAGLEQPGWLRAELMVGALERLGGDGAPDLSRLHELLTTQRAAGGSNALPQTAGIRRSAVELLRGAVYGQVATGVGLGLVLPLAGLVLFGLAGSLLHRGSQLPQPSANDAR